MGTEVDPSVITDDDRKHLRRCVELAEEALEDGDEPFGSLLVDGAGVVRFEDHSEWRTEWGLPAGPVAPLRIHAVAPGIPVAGPDPEVSAEMRAIHARSVG